MSDYILRCTAAEGTIRAYVANTTEIVQKASEIHKTSVSATAALGRLLTAASILGTMFKNEEDLITLAIRGDGPLRGIVATSDMTGNVKGYVFDPAGDVPLRTDGKIDVAGAIGNGTLSVVKDVGLKEPYVGQVTLVSGEIAEDLTHYFSQSEQTPSSVALGVLVDRDYSIKAAGGFLVQLMPNVSEEVIDQLEENIKSLPPITTLISQGKTNEEILQMVLGRLEPKNISRKEVEYYCNCGKDRVKKALISIGKEEIDKIIEEDKKANLHCHFCGKDYFFDEKELIEISNDL